MLLAEAVESVMEALHTDAPNNVGVVSLDEIEKDHIIKAMDETDGNLSAAARLLGVSALPFANG